MNNSQTPTEENFDDTELGLQKPDVKNRFLINYIKTLSFLLGRDEPRKIWRMLKTDNYGNLRVTPGPQPSLPPKHNVQSVPGNIPTKLLSFNVDRKAWMIRCGSYQTNAQTCGLFISFSQQILGSAILLPNGWFYRDENYNGDVWVQPRQVLTFIIEWWEFF